MLTISGVEARACFVDDIINFWKLIVWFYGSSSQGISFNEIYNLSGHPAISIMIIKPGCLMAKSNPSPTNGFFNLHYKVNPDNDGAMIICNSARLLMQDY